MEQPKIPHALFSDLERHADAIFKVPTCACFLAVDAGIPTPVARALLHYLRRRAKLLALDVRDFTRDNPEWAVRTLPNGPERRRLEDYGDDLTVYVAHTAAPDSAALRDLMMPLARQVALMLTIYHTVLLRDGQRLRWLFQAAVSAMQSGLIKRDRGALNPVGTRLRNCGVHLNHSTSHYTHSAVSSTGSSRLSLISEIYLDQL